MVLDCGNGRVDVGETCDDGNTESGDGCNADCLPGGQEVWTRTIDGGLQLNDWGHRVAVDADDDIYVTGIAFGVGNTERDAFLIKYDDDGQLHARFRGPSNLTGNVEGGVDVDAGHASLAGMSEGLATELEQDAVVFQ